MLKAGDKAPNFSLETDRGKTITLAELGDKPVILFFYPKDDTPGCTIECKEFRDALPKFEAKAHVLGISSDDQQSHVAFRDKFDLNFPLLVDPEGKVANEFGVWVAESKWGPMNKRATFILRGTTVDRVFDNVKPEGHAEEVLQALG